MKLNSKLLSLIIFILFVLLTVDANAQIFDFKITGMSGQDKRSGHKTDFITIKEPMYFTLNLNNSTYTYFDKDTHQKRVLFYPDFYADDSEHDIYIRFKSTPNEIVEIIGDDDLVILRHHYNLEDIVINYIVELSKR